MDKEFWNERYGRDEYVYGEEPNEYLKEHLPRYPVGSVLFPAEGEGRNAVFAAKLGWKVSAFDQSKEGQKKALKLAEKNHVTINYQVGEFKDIHYKDGEFDAIVLVYAHFPTDKKSVYHKILSQYLRKGGIIIFEGFSKTHHQNQQINKKAGGPKDIDMLFSIKEIRTDFSNCEIIELEEKEVELEDGLFHSGKGNVIRFIGRKK